MQRSNKLVSVAGIALVVLGAWLLTGRVLGPLFRPFEHVLSHLEAVIWPLALVAVGVMLLTAAKGASTGRPLVRSRTDRRIGGVLGGFAARFGMSSDVVRVLFVVLTVVGGVGAGVLVYIVALLVLPEESFATAPASTPWQS
jgi:phage shock protein PspC (stress-responsive transcriptional regulator)